MPKRRKSASKPGPQGYLHGYSRQEQERLYKQARFLEPDVYRNVDFSKQSRILEVGCGVGAQTEILLERFPHIHIDAIDSSKVQIARARRHLARAIRSKRVHVQVADARKLPFPDNGHDGAFLCWFLEHVKDPVQILKEIRRKLTTGGVIYCTEVMNASLYLNPYSPATLQYWFAYNDHQWNLGGDPFVGAKLANYLLAAGYQNIHTEVKIDHYDNRTPKLRAQFIEYWTAELLSGSASLISSGRVTSELVETMKLELERIKEDPDAVFFHCWIQARAQAL